MNFCPRSERCVTSSIKSERELAAYSSKGYFSISWNWLVQSPRRLDASLVSFFNCAAFFSPSKWAPPVERNILPVKQLGLASDPPGAPAWPERKGLMSNRPAQVALSLRRPRRRSRVERHLGWGWVSAAGGVGWVEIPAL